MKKILIVLVMIVSLTSCFDEKDENKGIVQKIKKTEALASNDNLNIDTKISEEEKIEIENIKNEIRELDRDELIKEEEKNIMIGSGIFGKETNLFIDILMLDPDYIGIIDCNSFVTKDALGYCTEKQKEYFKIRGIIIN